ncbi:lymphatic vessel endothelial hyaluronic receptor 1b isoform X2 [Syngnathoides biaculeatus]|uniref:lymphatic vessel endothelial hyaluronic receptor 1b isoform X2 n=1 Tax=Syngnathoides biaculeatus TaxID=300417 RepID=UPI002ADDF2D0|nr:lymphatic vessel endothelial hyaluronic receptor 1b isoform X2 [Syngnathoides biaculeatus]
MLARLLMLMLASMLPKASQCQNATRVFLLIEGEDYTINFAAAPAACQSYHATVATTANVEEALQHGLETCKYGWVAEQVAVIPRLTAHSKCGSNKTGLVKWYARADQVFGVFCYSATALPQLSSWPTTSSSASSTTTPDPPPLPSSTPAPTSAFTKTTKAPPTWTPTPAAITTSSPPLPHRASSSTGDPLPSRAVTSSPAPAASSSSSSPSSSSTSASGSASTQQTPRPTDASMQVWRALIILKLGVGFVIATAAGVLCTYYKLKKGPFSSWAKHVDDVEVEMCKPTYSRTDLHHPLGDDDWDLEAQEEDARDRKYSSEIFLRVNPHLRSSNKMS